MTGQDQVQAENTQQETSAAAEQAVVQSDETSDETVVAQDDKNISKTVKQDFPVTSPLTEEELKKAIALSLPFDTPEQIEEALKAIPNINIAETPEGIEWINRIKDSLTNVPYKHWFLRTLLREGSLFEQAVKSEKGPLTAGSLKFSDAVGTKLTGERAVLRVRAMTGMGSVVMVPLWHSGFWVTIKAPGEGVMLELYRRLTEEKIQLGRASYGLAYANNSVFFSGHLTDFVLSHVYDSTLKPELADDIRPLISQFDIPLLIWGLACAQWPSGFPYATAVLNDAKDPNKVIREKINVGKLLWVDTASLTPWQISHMAQRHGNSMTAESIKRYREEFTRGKGRQVEISDVIKVNLHTPSLDEYLVSGQKWVNNIVAMVDKALGAHPNEATRDDYILDHGRATNMRQYTHFVESIEVGDGIISDMETIEKTMDVLSADDSMREKFFAGVKEFVEDSTIAVVAMPVTNPNEKSEFPRFPHLVPLEVMAVFFTLLVQKVLEIQARS